MADAIDSPRHPEARASVRRSFGVGEASLEGWQDAPTRDHPSRSAQKRGHLRVNAIALIPGMSAVI